MSYLIQQILLCLLVAFLLGAIIGWMIKQVRSNRVIASLEGNLDRTNSEFKTANAQKEEVENHFSVFKSDSEKKIDEMQSENNSLSHQLSLVQQEVLELAPIKVEAEESRQKLHAFSGEIGNLKLQIDELSPYKTEAEEARETVASLSSKVGSLQQGVDELLPYKSEAEENRLKLKSLQSQYRMANAEFQSKKKNLSHKLSKLSPLPAQLRDHEAKIENLISNEIQYQKTIERLSPFQSKLEDAEKRIKLQEEKAEAEKLNIEEIYRKQLSEKETIIKEREGVLSESNDRLNQSKQSQKALKLQLDVLKQQLKDAETDRQNLANEWQTKLSAESEKSASAASNHAELEEQRRQVREQETAIQRLESQLRAQSAMDREMHELKGNIAGLQSSSSQKDKDLDQFKAKMNAIEQENKKLLEELNTAEKKADQNADLSAVLTTRERELKEAQSELATCRKSGSGQQQKIAELEGRLNQLIVSQTSEDGKIRNEKPASLYSEPLSDKASSSERTPLFTAPAEKDDLKKIYGIGPVMEGILNELGITSFKQISEFSKEDIGKVAAAIDTFPDRIERDDWVGGAKAEYQKKYS